MRVITQATQYRTFDPPPEGLDPLTASDASQLRYGLPWRPDPAIQPRLARLWKETLSRRTTFGKAELGEPFVREHRAARIDKMARPHEDILACSYSGSASIRRLGGCNYSSSTE